MNDNIDVLQRFSLQDKTAIVTGGCGMLGPQWVMALLEAGANVAIIDLPKAVISDELVGKAQDLEKKCMVFPADITIVEALPSIHEDIAKEFGSISILVNNAGIDMPPTKMSASTQASLQETARKMWDVNVQGMVNCIDEFSSDMKQNGGGSIINIGSLYMERSPYADLYTHLHSDKPWAYGSTKAAVGQLTRHYATRLAQYGIRVNTLSPGGVYGDQDQEFVKKFSERVPLRRMAKKEEDLGGPLVFLASDASSYITGINLQVSGGYTAW